MLNESDRYSYSETRYVLPADAELLAPDDLAPQARAKLGPVASGSMVVTRPGHRVVNRLIGPALASLLRGFSAPSQIAEAVLRFAQADGRDPIEALEDSFDALAALIEGGVLVPEGSPEANALPAGVPQGTEFAGYVVDARVHGLSDVEVYRASAPGGARVALKVARGAATPEFVNEARVLTHLAGGTAPHILAKGETGGRAWIALEWCAGGPVAAAAQRLRVARDRRGLRRLATTIANAFASLHGAGVVHGDVHPGNILADDEGRVTLVDFGRARIAPGPGPDPARAGIVQFHDPAMARALLDGAIPQMADPAAEQFAVATLIYLLLTGLPPIAQAADKRELLRRIVDWPVMPFAARGIAPWPAIERVLARALAKEPADRFADMDAFAAALAAVRSPARPRPRGEPATLAPALAHARNGWNAPPEPDDRRIAWFALRAALAREDCDLLAAAELWAARGEGAEAAVVSGAVARARSDVAGEGKAMAGFLAQADEAEPVQALTLAARLLDGAQARGTPCTALTDWAAAKLGALWAAGPPGAGLVEAALALVATDAVPPPLDLGEALYALPPEAGGPQLWVLAHQAFPLDGFEERALARPPPDAHAALALYRLTSGRHWLAHARRLAAREVDTIARATAFVELERPEWAVPPLFSLQVEAP